MALDLAPPESGEANNQQEIKGQQGKMATSVSTTRLVSPISPGLACVKLPMPSSLPIPSSLPDKNSGEGAAPAAEDSAAPETPDAPAVSAEPAESDNTTETVDSSGQSNVAEALPALSVDGTVAEPIVEDVAAPEGPGAPDAPEASAEDAAIAVEEEAAPAAVPGPSAVTPATEPPTPPAPAARSSTGSYSSAIAPGLANVRLPLPFSLAPGSGGSAVTGSSGAAAAADPVDESPAPPPSVPVEIGVYDEVTCIFGRGRVSAIREDGIHVVQALGWQLANEARPVYYMAKSALKRARSKAIYELSTAERLERAAFCKERGAAAFGEKRYADAAGLYYDALRSLEVREDLSNEERARMLDLMVPCHNNVATCQLRLNNPKDAVTAASNAHQLCEALQNNVKGQVMDCLRKRGVSDHKVFVQWKAKALFLAGKANVQRSEWTDAVKQLAAAVEVAEGHPDMDKELQGFQRLLRQAREHLKAKEKEAKKMWKGAFEKNSATAAVAAAPAATAAPAVAAPTAAAAASNGVAASNGPPAKAAAATAAYSNGGSAHVNGRATPAAMPNGGFAVNGFGAYTPLVPLKAVPKAKVAAESSSGEARKKGSGRTSIVLAITTAAAAALVAGAIVYAGMSRRKR